MIGQLLQPSCMPQC